MLIFSEQRISSLSETYDDQSLISKTVCRWDCDVKIHSSFYLVQKTLPAFVSTATKATAFGFSTSADLSSNFKKSRHGLLSISLSLHTMRMLPSQVHHQPWTLHRPRQYSQNHRQFVSTFPILHNSAQDQALKNFNPLRHTSHLGSQLPLFSNLPNRKHSSMSSVLEQSARQAWHSTRANLITKPRRYNPWVLQISLACLHRFPLWRSPNHVQEGVFVLSSSDEEN